MTSHRPSTVLAAAVVLVVAVIVLFGAALTVNRNSERESVRQRFRDEARVTAALTESVFGSSAAQQSGEHASKLGGREVDQRELTKLQRESQLAYAVLLDGRGNVISATRSADPSVLAAIGDRPIHVSRVLDGEPWRISGIIKGTTMEHASTFKGAGGPRVLVQGFPALLISGFIGGYLAQLPNAEREQAYVLDAAGRVIASASKDIKPGADAPPIGKGREIAEAAVGNSDWRVVLSQRKADLYRGIGSRVQWLILIALAAAGMIVVLLLRRAMRTAGDLDTAYRQLATAHEDLEGSNVELTRSNSELEQFASVASHDLQEPLRKVQAFGDQLERRFGDELPDEAKDYLRRMRGAAARMSVLIDDLLRFSRVTTHARPPVPVDLSRVAHEVTRDLDELVAETHGTVHIGDLPTVLADPTQMRQLLQNLIGNALKFHRPAEPPAVQLSPVASPEAGMVSFAVSDNGIGFESSYEDRIFRVFERLHPRDVYAGTGIGLALCRKIAERHSGTIVAEGRPHEGATFTVTLPGTGAAATAAAGDHQRDAVHA